MATKKKTTTTPSDAELLQEQIDAVRRASERQGMLNARASVENLLHGSNDPNAFAMLEKLRAEWSKLDSEPAPMSVTFDTKEFDDGWYWIATAANGEVVATSGDDAYVSKSNAQRALDRFLQLMRGQP